MLSVVEMTQFQQWCRSNCSGVAPFEDRVSVSLPKDLPQSQIVFDSETDIRRKVIRLLDKYVMVRAPFQLNLSYALRSQLEDFRANITQSQSSTIDDNTLAHCFDDVIDQIIRLLLDSFIRFKRAYDAALPSMYSLASSSV